MVERILGKAEVGSSILPGGTRIPQPETVGGSPDTPAPTPMAEDDKPQKPPGQSREAKLAQALRANLRRRKISGAQAAPGTHRTSTD